MTNAPFGAVAVQNIAGGAIRTRKYFIPASANTKGIFNNDFVRINPNGAGVTKVSADVAANTRILGAVSTLYDSTGKPLTFSQPTRGPFLPAGTAGYADVYDSVETIYMLQADGSAAESLVGSYVTITAASEGNTASGIGVAQVRVASNDTSVKYLQIVGIARTEERGLGSVAARDGWGNTFVDLLVRVALHNYT